MTLENIKVRILFTNMKVHNCVLLYDLTYMCIESLQYVHTKWSLGTFRGSFWSSFSRFIILVGIIQKVGKIGINLHFKALT